MKRIALFCSALYFAAPSSAHAAPPFTPWVYLNISGTLEECQSRARAAFFSADFEGVYTDPYDVTAVYGDYRGFVACLVDSGIAVIVVGGPDGNTAIMLRDKLLDIFRNS